MWNFCCLFAVVFVLHGVGAVSLHHSPVWKSGPVVEVPAIAAKPVLTLTDHEIMTVAASLEKYIMNAGLACPDGVKTTLAFGMMMPRIPVSAMRLSQMILGSAMSEQMSVEMIKLIGDVIGTYFAPVMNLPRFPQIVKVLNNKLASLDDIVDMIIEAPVNSIKMVTVGDVTQHIKALVAALKAVPCMDLIQAADIEAFKEQVPVVVEMKKSAKMNADVVKMVNMRVCQVMKHAAGCGAVAVKAIGAVHAILDIIIDNAEKIAMNLPAKLPIDIFLINIVSLTRPQAAPAWPKLPASAMPGWPQIPAPAMPAWPEVPAPAMPAWPKVPAASIAFPGTTDVCYQQKFLVYHAAVLRLLTNIRMMAIKMTIASMVPATGAIAAIPAIVKDTMPEDFLAAKLKPVLKIVLMAAHKITKDVVDVRRKDELSMAAVVHTINVVLPFLTGDAICAVAPAVLKSALKTTIKNMKLTFDRPVGAVGQLGSILTAAQVEEFVTKVAPIEEDFKVAFGDVMIDFRKGVFSTRPLIAIITMVNKMDVEPVMEITGTIADLVVKDVLARHGVPSTEPIIQVPVDALRMVVANLVAELELMVPASCRRLVALKFAEGWMKHIIANKIGRTERFAMMLLKSDPTVNVNMGDVKAGLKVVLANEMGVIFSELDKIQGINAVSKEVEDVVAFKKAGMDLTVGVVLQRLVKAAAHIIPKPAGHCAIPDLAQWTAFIHTVTNRMHNLPVMIGPVVMQYFGHNPQAAAIVMTSLSAMYEELAATLAHLTTMQDLHLVRELFIEHLVERLHMVPKVHPAIIPIIPAISHHSMKAADVFNSQIFTNIHTKYSEILSGLLKGKLSADVTVADVEKIINTVKAEVLAMNKRDMDIKIKPYSLEERLGHVLDIMKQLKISDLPEDVKANVLITMARDVQNAIPEACRLPVRVKFMAALFQHMIEELSKIGADHPIMAMLIPMFDSAAMPLPTVQAILETILPVMRKIGIEAMNKVTIFAHTGPLRTFIAELLKVKGDAKPAEVFPIMKSRLMTMVTADPAICAPVDVKAFVMQTKAAFRKAFKSAELGRGNLHAALAGIQGVKTGDVVEILVGKVIPAMEEEMEDGLKCVFQAVHNQEYFPVVVSHIIVHLMEVKTTPLYHLMESPIYEIFMERTHKRLMTEIIPLIPAPQTPAKIENVIEICARAYMQTLHIVFGPDMDDIVDGIKDDDMDMNVIDMD